MDCKQAELYIMQHFDKTIEPENAQDLLGHMQICESCRELYLLMDEMEEIDLVEAPIDFTSNVMEKVRNETVAATVVTVAKSSGISGGFIMLKILWSLSLVTLGIGTYFVFNPDVLGELAINFSFVDVILNGLTSIGMFMGRVYEHLTFYLVPAGDTGNFSIIALLFALMMGTLLFVLHNSEKRVKT